MNALVDTSVLIATTSIRDEQDTANWAISAVSLGELEAGVLLALDAETRAARLRRLSAVLAEAPVIPIDQYVAVRYGELRAVSGRGPTNDLWIAATALSHDLLLITADERLASLPQVTARLVP